MLPRIREPQSSCGSFSTSAWRLGSTSLQKVWRQLTNCACCEKWAVERCKVSCSLSRSMPPPPLDCWAVRWCPWTPTSNQIRIRPRLASPEMLTAFLTHNPEDLVAYYGRALPELNQVAHVVCNPIDRDLSTAELVVAATDCDVIIAHRST